jgi:hypothetical protein
LFSLWLDDPDENPSITNEGDEEEGLLDMAESESSLQNPPARPPVPIIPSSSKHSDSLV